MASSTEIIKSEIIPQNNFLDNNAQDLIEPPKSQMKFKNFNEQLESLFDLYGFKSLDLSPKSHFLQHLCVHFPFIGFRVNTQSNQPLIQQKIIQICLISPFNLKQEDEFNLNKKKIKMYYEKFFLICKNYNTNPVKQNDIVNEIIGAILPLGNLKNHYLFQPKKERYQIDLMGVTIPNPNEKSIGTNFSNCTYNFFIIEEEKLGNLLELFSIKASAFCQSHVNFMKAQILKTKVPQLFKTQSIILFLTSGITIIFWIMSILYIQKKMGYFLQFVLFFCVMCGVNIGYYLFRKKRVNFIMKSFEQWNILHLKPYQREIFIKNMKKGEKFSLFRTYYSIPIDNKGINQAKNIELKRKTTKKEKRIIEILKDRNNKKQQNTASFGKDKNILNKSILNGEDLNQNISKQKTEKFLKVKVQQEIEDFFNSEQ